MIGGRRQVLPASTRLVAIWFLPARTCRGARQVSARRSKHGLRDWLVYRGRASRSAYWWFILFTVIVSVALDVIVFVIAGHDAAPSALVTALLAVIVVLYAVVAVCLGLAGLALLVRRLHDSGRSGWWVLIGACPARRRDHAPGLHAVRRDTRTQPLRPCSSGRGGRAAAAEVPGVRGGECRGGSGLRPVRGPPRLSAARSSGRGRRVRGSIPLPHELAGRRTRPVPGALPWS